jgi:branched-chain amino acid transport system permease protein
LAGAGFAVLLGWVTTKKSGTTFAMITLGMGELVFRHVADVPRVLRRRGRHHHQPRVRQAVLWHHLRPAIQVYYLIAVYCFVCTAAMFAFTRTPLGRMLNAVRDNPERVEFIGYNTQRVRYLAFIIAASLPASGGLAASTFEIVTAEAWSVLRSGATCCSPSWAGPRSSSGPSSARC